MARLDALWFRYVFCRTRLEISRISLLCPVRLKTVKVSWRPYPSWPWPLRLLGFRRGNYVLVCAEFLLVLNELWPAPHISYEEHEGAEGWQQICYQLSALLFGTWVYDEMMVALRKNILMGILWVTKFEIIYKWKWGIFQIEPYSSKSVSLLQTDTQKQLKYSFPTLRMSEINSRLSCTEYADSSL